MVAADKSDARPVECRAVDGRAARWHRLARSQHCRPRRNAAGVDGRVQVGPQHLGQRHRAVDVQVARALLQQVLPGQRLRGVLQDGLDQRRRQARVGLQHQRHGASHGGGRNRGAAEHHLRLGQCRRDTERRDQLAVVEAGQEVPAQAIAGCGRSTDDLVARRHQVGLEQVVDPAHATGIGVGAARRPARAEQVHAVVAARGGVVKVDGAHGDGGRIVARCADGTVGFLALPRQAEVAAGHHHRDAGRRGTAHRDAQRVGLPGLRRGRGQAQVQHPDVVFLGVVDHPLNAFEHVAERAHAIAVEHLDVDDVGPGRHAGDVLGCRALGRVVAAGGHRGDVRTVAVGVVGDRAVVGNRVFVGGQRRAARLQRTGGSACGPVGQRGVEHVDIAPDADRRAAGLELKGVMRAHHTRVEHRNADAVAVQAAVAAGRAVSAHVGRGRAADRLHHAGGAARFAVGHHARHVAALRQCVHGARRHYGRQPADARMPHLHRPADARDESAQVGQFGIGRIGDDDDLDMAHAADVAHMAALGRDRRIERAAQVLRDLLVFGLGVGAMAPAGGAEHEDGDERHRFAAAQRAALNKDGEPGELLHGELQCDGWKTLGPRPISFAVSSRPA